MLQNAGVLNILTCKCASRHSGVHFFDIKPPKSGPYPSVFPHFDLKMCFAPQWRAILPDRNFQNWSRTEVFWAFWLINVLRATAACNFWTSELQKVLRHRQFFFAFSLPNVLFATAACNFWTLELQKWLRDCGVLCILTYKCASRHSAVPFFTCLLNSCLRTRRFSEATFRTSETTNHWKNTAIRNVPNISRTCTCFLVTLHARWSSSTRVLIFLRTWHLYSAFQLCILSEVRLLNFLRLWQDSFFTSSFD